MFYLTYLSAARSRICEVFALKLKFDANQEYQIHAIEAVANLFEGQGYICPEIKMVIGSGSIVPTVANRLDLTEEQILENLRRIQEQHGISPDDELKTIEKEIETTTGIQTLQFLNFSVEMETGTGKTYVYLRTIFELNKRYGLRKFIIVVPSIAIREGVLKTLKITERHFRELYENIVYNYYVYDSANLTQVRQFALSQAVEIMIMTIDSFNKAANIIRQSTDRLQGETPIYLIQETRPILILDEPQNMESEKSITALASLKPLFALRYSATHRVPYNLVYRLTPFEAYRRGLVKKVEVASVVEDKTLVKPYIAVEEIKSVKKTLTARVRVHKLYSNGTIKETAFTVKPGDSLEEKTGLPYYAGYVIDELNAGAGYILFTNGVQLSCGEELGSEREALFRAQIRETISTHFKKQERLRDKGIKILSLFFIDRVGNYTDPDGIIRKLFDELFNELKVNYPAWKDLEPEDVRAAYFAQKRRKSGEIEYLESKTGESADDAMAYDLIMKDKELLLSFPSPDDDDETRHKKQVAFIFSHSALREGWDNPNIFQICTLNQTMSTIKKRQEVGRGIRLPVNQTGERVFDETINVLTVVANENYADYVKHYQDDIAENFRLEIEARYGKPIGDLSLEERRRIEEEYGEGILPPPPRKAGENCAKLQKARVLSDDFKELWERIKHKTRYAVNIDVERLVNDVVSELEMITVAKPRILVTKAIMELADNKNQFMALQSSASKEAGALLNIRPIPNIIDLLENFMENTTPKLKLTRKTLLEIFLRLSNKGPALENPQEWANKAVQVIKFKMAEQLVNGICYEKTGEWYDMRKILEEEEIELFSKYIVSADNSIYDLIPCDSNKEKNFVEALENRKDIRLYVKLPSWFVVPTPLGDYNPDWAIVIDNPQENGPVLYLVAETKGSDKFEDLRSKERWKILCGASHFGSKKHGRKGALDGVEYKVVKLADELP